MSKLKNNCPCKRPEFNEFLLSCSESKIFAKSVVVCMSEEILPMSIFHILFLRPAKSDF